MVVNRRRERNTFFWSLRNSGDEFQFLLHGLLVDGTDHWAWSYGEQSFFMLNDATWPNVNSGPVFYCE
ncbi:MAG: hypothetical protein HRU32_09790 [Rhodobacteraceae bacterium]|nr:hypothetical protein [Paracoccaceae bacterium]